MDKEVSDSAPDGYKFSNGAMHIFASLTQGLSDSAHHFDFGDLNHDRDIQYFGEHHGDSVLTRS
jgi:hypothetical protein